MIRVRRLGRMAFAVAIAGGAILARPGELGLTPALDDAAATAAGTTAAGVAAESAPTVTVVGTPPPPSASPTPIPSPSPSPALGLPTHQANARSTRQLRFAVESRVLDGYVWPLPRGILTLPFGPSRWGSRIVDGEPFHDGIDVATVCGDKIVAAHDGVVLAAGRRFDDFMGWLGDLAPYYARLDDEGLWWTLPIAVVIDDGNGYRSVYAHFSRVTVKAGQRVQAGELIGYEGMTGRATGCHLHYGLFSPAETETFAIDPKVVKRMKVPPFQIARIDPLTVLPPRPQDQPEPASSTEPTTEPTADPSVEPARPSAEPSLEPARPNDLSAE